MMDPLSVVLAQQYYNTKLYMYMFHNIMQDYMTPTHGLKVKVNVFIKF